MSLEAGDYVITRTGLHGRIVHVSKHPSLFEVEVELDGGQEILPFFLNELIKVEPPQADSLRA